MRRFLCLSILACGLGFGVFASLPGCEDKKEETTYHKETKNEDGTKTEVDVKEKKTEDTSSDGKTTTTTEKKEETKTTR